MPREDAQLMATTAIPLVRRLLVGFMAREGMREGEAARLEWTDLDLDHAGGGGSVSLDENKTDDPRSWSAKMSSIQAQAWPSAAPSPTPTAASPFMCPSQAAHR